MVFDKKIYHYTCGMMKIGFIVAKKSVTRSEIFYSD